MPHYGSSRPATFDRSSQEGRASCVDFRALLPTCRALDPAASVASLDPGQAADPKPLAIGAPAPDFRLPGTDGKTYTLADFSGSKALMVVFTCNHCPTANAYEARLARFQAEYAPRGVKFVAISPNDPLAVRPDELGYTDLDDSFAAMKIRARDHHFAYPYLYDGETQATSREFGVLATPHVFVFDADRKLRYQGRFDDGEVKPVKSHDAINAVEAILADKPVAVETTRVVGCSTKWSDKRENARQWLAKADAEPVTPRRRSPSLATVTKLIKNDDQDQGQRPAARQPLGHLVRAMRRGAPRARRDEPDVPAVGGSASRRSALDEPGKRDEAIGDPRKACTSPLLNYQLTTDNTRPVRRGARQGLARPAALHDADRSRGKSALPEVGRGGPP